MARRTDDSSTAAEDRELNRAHEDFENELTDMITNGLALDDDAPASESADEVVEGDIDLVDDDGAGEGGEGAEGAEGAAEGGEEVEEGASATGERARGEDGRFLPKDGKDGTATETPAKGAAAATATAATDAAAAKPAADAAEPKWEPLSLSLDGKDTVIEEAHVQRRNGYTYLAIPDTKFPNFHNRMSAGVAGQRLWRQLHDGLRELDVQRNAPKPKTEEEIQAQIFLEEIKPYLADIFTPEQLEKFDLKVENAIFKARQEFADSERQRAEKAAEQPWEEKQASLLAEQTVQMFAHPDFKDVPKERLEALFAAVYKDDLLPVRDALIKRDDKGGITANTEYIFGRLKRALAAGIGSTTSTTSATNGNGTTSASSGTPASRGSATTTATAPATGKAATGERFNRGVDTSRKPASTNVKGNRTTGTPSRPARETAPVGAGRRTDRDEQLEAEEAHRKATRSFMSSPGFDFATEGDEE